MADCPCEETEGVERKTLGALLAVNAVRFLAEATTCWPISAGSWRAFSERCPAARFPT